MTHTDQTLDGFLHQQYVEGKALADASDILTLEPRGPAPVRLYFAHLDCCGRIRQAGRVVPHSGFLFAVCFPDFHLRRFDTARVVTLCQPRTTFGPNILAPFVCLGRMAPGTTLVDLLYQIYEVVTFQNVEMREHNALNRDACSWARNHLDQLPTDQRPLRRPVQTNAAAPG